MNMETTPTSTLAASSDEGIYDKDATNDNGATLSEVDAFRLPVETEIYLLPNGEVVVADLPAELALLIKAIGAPKPEPE